LSYLCKNVYITKLLLVVIFLFVTYSWWKFFSEFLYKLEHFFKIIKKVYFFFKIFSYMWILKYSNVSLSFCKNLKLFQILSEIINIYKHFWEVFQFVWKLRKNYIEKKLYRNSGKVWNLHKNSEKLYKIFF